MEGPPVRAEIDIRTWLTPKAKVIIFFIIFHQICQQRITDILYSEEAQIKKPWGLESMGFLSSSVSLTMERQ